MLSLFFLISFAALKAVADFPIPAAPCTKTQLYLFFGSGRRYILMSLIISSRLTNVQQGRGRSDNSLKEPISKSNIMAIVSKAVSKINVLLINKHELTVNALS